MINEKLQELMNEELDGTLSPKRKEELNSHLEKNEDARQLMNKLRLIHSNLSKVEEIEPPRDLKESVMGSLPVVRQTIKQSENSVISRIISLVEVPRFQMAGMFSLGMAAALLLFVIAENYSGNQKPVAEKAIGTMVLLNNADNAEVIDSKLIYTDGCNASVKTYRHEDKVVAEIDLDSPESRTVQIFVTSEKPGELRFSAMEQAIPNLVFANFGFDYFSAALSGSGKLILAFEDIDNSAGPIQIELKTETSSAVAAVAIQKVNL